VSCEVRNGFFYIPLDSIVHRHLKPTICSVRSVLNFIADSGMFRLLPNRALLYVLVSVLLEAIAMVVV
jgi:hypothetical protein